MSPNTEYSQLAALGAWCEKHPHANGEPLRPPMAQRPAQAEQVDEHVGAAETPNAEYSQLEALGRYLQTHPSAR